jgi:hypothetical protein
MLRSGFEAEFTNREDALFGATAVEDIMPLPHAFRVAEGYTKIEGIEQEK